jgi:hypothetical protein
MKSGPSSNPEYAAFESLLKTVLSVPHSEIKRRLDADKKAKETKKRPKKNASRASSDRER